MTTPDVQPALASDEELAWLRKWLSQDRRSGQVGNFMVQRVLARLDAAGEREKALREALNIDAAVHAAAITWCGEKDRETFLSDVKYFEHNWSALSGLKAYVDRELGKRARAALEARSHD